MRRAALSVLCGLSLSALAATASAQERLPALGRSTVSTDDTTALVTNPANIAMMPGGELRWSSIYLDEDVRVPYQGHAFALGFPLPFVPLVTGFRFDLIDPPAQALLLGRYPGAAAADNYEWFTWGLGLRTSETSAIGFSYQHAYSESRLIDGLSSWSLGLTSRPFDELGFGFVARDLNGPTNAAGGHIDPSYVMALGIRPFGTRAVQLDLEGKYIGQDSDLWVPRAVLGVDIPPLGQLRGDFSVIDPTEEYGRRRWLASAAMAFYLNSPNGAMEVAGGSLTGDALGQDDSYNVQVDVAFRGFREPVGPEAPRVALRLRMEETPGTRQHVALLRRLWDIAEHERTVDAVVFELRTSPADSLAEAEELRDAMFYLRRKGKRVLCHLEDASGSALYVCSAANKILMNPAGGLRFAGLSTKHIYFKGLLDKLGIHADFVRIGAHKSAPEQFTRKRASEVARADKIDLLQQYEKRFVADVAAGRGLSAKTVRSGIAKGPFIASEAKAAGFIDDYAFDDQIGDAVDKLCGRSLALMEDKLAVRGPERFGRARRLALVYADGDIIDGRSQTIPLIGTKLIGSYSMAETIKQVREDPEVAAVVLRIDSPGGSAMASDVMWREIQLTAAVKPVVVSMGGVAASGGYYIAAPATRIFANPLTVTGSIGIFYGKADIAELLSKIGVNVETYKTAPRADAESIFRPFTAGEKRELRRKVGQFYDTFLSRVATGRKLDKQAVDKVGQGRVWTGEQAHAHKLVDEIGGLRQAIEYARRASGLPDHAPIIELPPPDTSLLGMLLGIEGLKSDASVPPLPRAVTSMLRSLGPFLIYPGDKPLALMEFTVVDP